MKSETRILMNRHGTPSLFLALIALPALGQNHPAWQQQQSLDVAAPGLIRVALPSDTLGASQPRLGDLRLVAPSGGEVPYTIEWPVLASVSTQPVAGFRASLGTNQTVLEIITGSEAAIDLVQLNCASPRFIKSATLEGSADGATWQPMLAQSLLFREASGIEQLSLSFPSAVWKHLRVTLDDAKSPPVAFTAASVRQHGSATTTQDFAANIAAREEVNGQTRLTLHAPNAHPFLGELTLSVGDALFHREVRLTTMTGSTIASGMIYRTVVDGQNASVLALPVHRQLEGSDALVIIDNRDSPPLRIDGIKATRYPVSLVFQAEAAGGYTLYMGHAQATAPSYDITAIADQLRKATASTAKLGALVANAAFDATATLPQTVEPGASAELAEWSRRRTVSSPTPGVLRIVLDAEVLAHTQAGFGDLRLLQAEHHLPFIIEPVAEPLEVAVTLTFEPDAQRPKLSRWLLSSPVPGLPIDLLTVQSPSTLFERHVTLWHTSRDHYGNDTRLPHGSTTWQRTPATASRALTLPLAMYVPEERWFIETDNGDNAPLQLATTASLRYRTHALLCRTTSAAPVQLYYGNTKATMPRYDVHLIEGELRAATQTLTTLGEVEVLKATPATPNTSAPGKGSPWLWAALAAVVAGLLIVVSKMLPKVEA